MIATQWRNRRSKILTYGEPTRNRNKYTQPWKIRAWNFFCFYFRQRPAYAATFQFNWMKFHFRRNNHRFPINLSFAETENLLCLLYTENLLLDSLPFFVLKWIRFLFNPNDNLEWLRFNWLARFVVFLVFFSNKISFHPSQLELVWIAFVYFNCHSLNQETRCSTNFKFFSFKLETV